MFEVNEYPQEIAEALYSKVVDMDYADHAESANAEISQLTVAIYDVMCIAKNEYNDDYWRTLYRALEKLVDM